ncbi:MAG TPA: sialidase family protein, partial [Candidatus Dormibacteraeota bacterium]|nr:sialidase family protein [Candidatus Dormibacteraeota bacterium]
FVASNVWVARSTDGGTTWTNTAGSQFNAVQPGSAAAASSLCNTYPGGIAVGQNGAHAGRVYVVWNAGDTGQNQTNGCNVTSAQPFDHIFLSYSDDNGSTWTTHTVFNDPCAPSPPVPPVNPTTCQDTSAGWTPVAVDDAGNVYVAFTWIDTSKPNPRYDVYLEVSKDGGNSWNGGTVGLALGVGDAPGAPIDVTANLPGTSFYPELAAGGTGGVDIGLYNTAFTTSPGTLNKAGAQPESAVWDVYLAQSLNGLDSSPLWTISKVTTHPNYFGDICTVGIACGALPSIPGDRILADNFGISVAPDGGARVTWTDTRDSWTSTCKPGPPGDTSDSNVSCQNTHVYFACQTSGLGIAGQTVTGCGQSQLLSTDVPESPLVPALVLGAGAVAMLARQLLRRRSQPNLA